jgi:anti-anti-sigma factor
MKLAPTQMMISRDGETLSVSQIGQLDAASCRSFRSRLQQLLPTVQRIDIDLSRTRVDCGGVGALIALRNCARRQNQTVAIRLLNPTAVVRRLFTLTQMDRVFPIEHR